ncbi:MAG: alpha/beta hydrolase [Rhizomicrobium sp.]
MNNPSRQTLARDEGGVSQLVWDGGEPLLHFAHATGFNAETYRGMLSPLADRFRIVASDARGHGSTTLPAQPGMPRGWKIFRDDLIAILDRVAPQGAILAGHSMGGAVSLMAAAARPGKVRALVLIEPVLMPQSLWWRMMLARFGLRPSEPGLAERALKRRDVFPSLEMALAAYRGRGAFKTWPKKPSPTTSKAALSRSRVVSGLRCRPAWESECFRSAPFGRVAVGGEGALSDHHSSRRGRQHIVRGRACDDQTPQPICPHRRTERREPFPADGISELVREEIAQITTTI